MGGTMVDPYENITAINSNQTLKIAVPPEKQKPPYYQTPSKSAMGCRCRLHSKAGNRIPTKEELIKFFMKFDINHDNSLSREELRKAFDDLGAWFPSYRAGRGLSHADANNDGQIDIGELNDLVNYAYELGYTVH